MRRAVEICLFNQACNVSSSVKRIFKKSKIVISQSFQSDVNDKCEQRNWSEYSWSKEYFAREKNPELVVLGFNFVSNLID